MKFRCLRQDLHQEMQLISGIIERKATMPILTQVLVQAAESQVQLSATDMDIYLQSRCPAMISEEGVMALPARELAEMFRNQTDGEVLVEGQEEKSAVVTFPSTRYDLIGMDPTEYPRLMELEGDFHVLEIEPQKMLWLIQRTLFAITEDDTKYAFHGALFQLSKGRFRVVSTDSHRLSFAEVAIEGWTADAELLVPRKGMSHLKALLSVPGEGRAVLKMGEKHLVCDWQERILLSRLLVGQFPRFEKAIEQEFDKEAKFSRDQLIASLRRTAIFSLDEVKTAAFELAGDRLTVRSTDPNKGLAVDEIAVEYAGEPFKISFNSRYVMEFLQNCPSDQVRLRLSDPEKQGRFEAVMDDPDSSFLYIIMPLRLESQI